MVQRLENLDGVMGVEIGLSHEVDANTAALYIQAATGELPLVARLPMERARDLIYALAGLEVAAVSLGPPRGALLNPQGEIIHGRLYGPAVFPQALATLKAISQVGVPVIGAGGIYNPQDIQAMQDAGAMAVQLDAVLWRDGVPENR
jgi:dihydroorotate dehydrogenase (NAD+) catalytic subunit